MRISDWSSDVCSSDLSLSRDLVFLLALNGNDYLPKLRGMSFDVVFDSYVAAMNSLPHEKRGLFRRDGLHPNWLALKVLFNMLAKEHQPSLRAGKAINPALLVEECLRDQKIPAMTLEVKTRAPAKGAGAEFCARYFDPETNETLFTSGWELSDKIARWRSEEHTSELQSLMRISYAVFCLQKKNTQNIKDK